MTLPANIRVNIAAPFPSLVKGSGPVTIAKHNGIWTVGFTIANLAAAAANTDPTTIQVLLYNTVLNTFQKATIASLLASTPLVSPTLIGIAQSPYLAQLNDSILYVDTSGGAVVINLQTAASRILRPLTIKDVSGNANANNITINPNGAETIEGLAPLKVNADYGGFTLYPATAKYVIAP